jgi:hypothetical protein
MKRIKQVNLQIQIELRQLLQFWYFKTELSKLEYHNFNIIINVINILCLHITFFVQYGNKFHSTNKIIRQLLRFWYFKTELSKLEYHEPKTKKR